MKRFLLGATLAFSSAGCARFSGKPLDTRKCGARISDPWLGSRVWTLKALVDDAMGNFPEVAFARAQYETASAAIRTAGQRPNPTVLIASQTVTGASENSKAMRIEVA